MPAGPESRQKNAKRTNHKAVEKPKQKPLFATADPSRATTVESRKSVKENAFKKLLVAGDIAAARLMLSSDPILSRSDLQTKIQRGNSFLHASITLSRANSEEFAQLIIDQRCAALSRPARLVWLQADLLFFCEQASIGVESR